VAEDLAGRSASGRESGDGAALSAAGWLSLAPAPAFAVMALLTSMHNDGPADSFCSAAHVASPLNGMTLMYALMSVFHVAPWLKLIASRRSGKRASGQ
jgi:hypothetical protein